MTNIETGRIAVTGKVTVYFADEALMREAMRPIGHWCSYPRKYKRLYRKEWQLRHDLPARKARGWRRYVRRMKAKA